MKGTKLNIYQGQGDNYTKPERVLTFTDDMIFSEVNKIEMSGKQHVMKLKVSKQEEPIFIAAPGTNQLNKWMKGFKDVKKSFFDVQLVNKEKKKQTPLVSSKSKMSSDQNFQKFEMDDKSKNLKESKQFKEKVQQLLEVAQSKGQRKRQYVSKEASPNKLQIHKTLTCQEQSHPNLNNNKRKQLNTESIPFKHAKSDTKLRSVRAKPEHQ